MAIKTSQIRSLFSSSHRLGTSQAKVEPSVVETENKTAVSDQLGFWDAIKNRRTYYALNKEAPIPDERIVELVNRTVLEVPSAFNTQSTRVLVLLGKQHDELWDIATEVLKAIVPADKFEPTQQKLDGFKAAYGSVSLAVDLRNCCPLLT
jgi:predicted oxidoreductase (fatty acid repression mutant protein)